MNVKDTKDGVAFVVIQWLWLSLPESVRSRLRLDAIPKKINFTATSLTKLDNSNLRPGDEVEVVLDPKSVVSRDVVVPVLSRSDLRNALKLEAHRVFPVDQEHLAVAYRRASLQENGASQIRVAAVKRTLIDGLSDNLKSRGGILSRVSVAIGSPALELNFKLPAANRLKGARTLLSLAFVLTAIAGLALGPGYYLERLQTRIEELDENITSARQYTSSIVRLQNEISTKKSLVERLHKERITQRLIPLFSDLSMATPDNIVFQEVRLDRNRIFVSGKALAPEDWLLSLSDNASFTDAALASITQDGAGTAKRFEMRATYIWPNTGLVAQ